MKITFDIAAHHIKTFRAIEKLTGVPWKEAFIQEINETELVEDHPRALAFAAMGFCKTDEHAEAVIERALELAENRVPYANLWFEYEERAGKISFEEQDLLRTAAQLMSK